MLGVQTNLLSMNVQRNLVNVNRDIMQSTQRLSSGYRINSAKDDASGLILASRFETQIRGMNVAARNTNDAISLVQTAEGATNTMTEILQRMREIAVSASSDSNDDDARTALDSEFQQLKSELDRIVTSTSFNGEDIIGTGAGAKVFQVGANSGDTISITTTDLSTLNDGIGDVTSQVTADASIGTIDTALDTINAQRTTYGAVNSRLEYTAKNLGNMVEQASSAKSRIMDTDYAAESARLAKAQILQQVGVAMLGQANMSAQSVLSLLR